MYNKCEYKTHNQQADHVSATNISIYFISSTYV